MLFKPHTNKSRKLQGFLFQLKTTVNGEFLLSLTYPLCIFFQVNQENNPIEVLIVACKIDRKKNSQKNTLQSYCFFSQSKYNEVVGFSEQLTTKLDCAKQISSV